MWNSSALRRWHGATLIFALLASPTLAATPVTPAPVVAAERAFAADGLELGIQGSFLKHSAPEGIRGLSTVALDAPTLAVAFLLVIVAVVACFDALSDSVILGRTCAMLRVVACFDALSDCVSIGSVCANDVVRTFAAPVKASVTLGRT